PVPLQVFCHDPSMTLLWRRLAAQKAIAVRQRITHGRFDSSFFHEHSKRSCVLLPGNSSCSIRAKHCLRRCQRWAMHVVDHADSGKKKLEIITLGKTRKLASIVEPYVDDTPHAGLPQDGEELLGCLFGK